MLLQPKLLHIGGYDGEEGPLYKKKGYQFTFVEPVPEFAERIREKGYKVIQCAVGKEGEICFYLHDRQSSYLKEKGQQNLKTITVRSVSLASIQHGYNMLVIDAQGATYDIIKSGNIKKFMSVTCEVSKVPRYEGEADYDTVYKYLKDNGFTLQHEKKHIRDIYDLEFIRANRPKHFM